MIIINFYFKSTHMDAFDKAEYNNRPAATAVFAELIKTDPRFKGWQLKETNVEDKDRYDFWLEKDDKKIIIEHKHRAYRMDVFPDWQIAGSKVNHLRDLCKNTPDIVGVYYINTFPDNHTAIWNLMKPIGEWRWSRPHRLKTVMNSNWCQTYDLFLTLDEAEYVN